MQTERKRAIVRAMGIGVDGLDEAARLWVEAGGGKLPVSGRSMRPTFEDASGIRMAPPARARFGDVLVYRTGIIIVVHRVVAVRSGGRCRTKGDGLPHVDVGLVTPEQVLGVVIEVERNGRRYRTDRIGGRLYAGLAGLVSAAEGLLYRIAWRVDRLLGLLAPRRAPDPASGLSGPVTISRRSVRAAGRGSMRLVDTLLFRALHAPACVV